MQAYEGYFENGTFRTARGAVALPEGRRVFITVLEEPPLLDNSDSKKIFWGEFDKLVDESADELLNMENFKRLNINRELFIFAEGD
jgi:hypothetical protein